MFSPRSEHGAATDRRVNPRQTVTYRMDVLASDGTVGYLIDISLSGMRVFFKHGLDVAGVSTIRIEFPRWLELGSGFEASGRFVWVRPSAKGSEGGFAFSGLSKVERVLLGRMIEQLNEAVSADEAV